MVNDAGALAATLTTSVMAGYDAPAGKASFRVQVSEASAHDQPVPAIDVAVSPAGSVSVTVTVPEVAALPPLDPIDRHGINLNPPLLMVLRDGTAEMHLLLSLQHVPKVQRASLPDSKPGPIHQLHDHTVPNPGRVCEQ